MLRVAIGFDKDKKSDIRFGNLKFVNIYEITDENIKLIEQREIPDISSFESKDQFSCHGRNDDFLEALAHSLEDTKYLIVGESGNYPSRVLLRHGISLLEQQGETCEILKKIKEYEKEGYKVLRLGAIKL